MIVSCLVSICCTAKSIDTKISNAMNSSDWFALDSIYASTPKDSIHPFLETYTRCLLGNRLNRPDVSIPAFEELLSSHSSDLDLGNLISSTYMLGMDLSRVGRNADAASYIEAVINSAKQYLDQATIESLKAAANRYAALARYNPYLIDMPQGDHATIPFKIVTVGPADKGSVHIHLKESTINDIAADITFDTGAAANVISVAMAEKYNLIPLDSAAIKVKGFAQTSGNIAIAKELKIGEITVHDVPFIVLDMTSHNEEADQYFDSFNIVVGSELMLQLKDLTLDFINNEIIIPTEAPKRSDQTPNLCFSSTMNLLTAGKILDTITLMNLDTGDAGYGSVGQKFYKANKKMVKSNGRKDSIRQAGVGGFMEVTCYYVPGLPVTIAGVTVRPDDFVVMLKKSDMVERYDANIGLKTMMLYGKIRFNMVDFVISIQQPENMTEGR